MKKIILLIPMLLLVSCSAFKEEFIDSTHKSSYSYEEPGRYDSSPN